MPAPDGRDSLTATPSKHNLRWDPVFVHARREAAVIVALFLLFFSYSILTCFFLGYGHTAEDSSSIRLIWGMPAWVFFGIFLPWCGVDLVAVWFCFFFMQDDNLNPPEEDGHAKKLEQSAKETSG